MGMYTEFVIATRIKNDPVAVEILKFMTSRGEQPQTLPDHPLFATRRWQWMLTCSSSSMSLLEYDKIGQNWSFISRSCFKNYDGEIDKFIDWLRPYLDCSVDEMIGYHRYEQFREPTIIYSTEST